MDVDDDGSEFLLKDNGDDLDLRLERLEVSVTLNPSLEQAQNPRGHGSCGAGGVDGRMCVQACWLSTQGGSKTVLVSSASPVDLGGQNAGSECCVCCCVLPFHACPQALALRRPALLSAVMLRQNPHNVAEWHKRVNLFKGDPTKQVRDIQGCTQLVPVASKALSSAAAATSVDVHNIVDASSWALRSTIYRLFMVWRAVLCCADPHLHGGRQDCGP